ncbi:CRISPR-associated Cas4 family protein [Lysinibacillus fusiformis ZC1]|uniref:CRISPR-associated protein Cas4 n=1 Tax=Lysinibacillus capsici TaxID=2115968 RepID=UPI0001DA56D5|nr:CRISPR-associated protein Cas4 [Lysinibacillus capsici]EFI68558.1 CRISPR-associated Cas4 family protein [Lysinibacillus fusiformis ZC1]
MQWDDLKATGLQVQYLKVCERKLWLHSHQLGFEDEDDKVQQGKVLHDTSYQRQKSKEVWIENLIRIDMMDKHYVGEVKSSSRMEQADKAQLLYYLFVLEQMGIYRKGKIHYPKEKRVDDIELTEEDREAIPKWLAQIQQIIQLDKPPKKKKLRYCTKCAYYSFCWVGEEE